MALTDTALKALRPKDKAYTVADDRGLYVEVFPTGGIVWRYRFEAPSRLAELAARPVIGLFRRWMARGLANLRAILAP